MKRLLFFIQIMIIPVLLYGQAEKEDITELKIKTSAQCSQCKERIETAMAYEKGVKSSNLDLETKILTVQYRKDRTTDDKIRLAITKLGYDADELKKDEKAYSKLPGCCKLPEDPEHTKH